MPGLGQHVARTGQTDMARISFNPGDHHPPADGLHVLLTFILWIIGSAVIATATYTALHAFTPAWSRTDGPTVVLVAEVYFLFLVSAAVVFRGWDGLRDRLYFRYTSGKDVLLALVAYLLSIGVFVLIYWVMSPVVGPLPQTLLDILRKASDMSRMPSADLVIWFFIITRACLLAPLLEELMFRGLLFGWLRSHLSAWVTIGLTAILFTSIHFYPILFPFAFVFGLAAGWVRERTGSSLVMVAAHFINSVLFLTIAYVLVSQMP